MKLVWLITMVISSLTGLMAQTPSAAHSPWEQPAASLADEIAGILGPGQAHLTIRNLSTISTGEIPAIRRLLEQDLKAHGVLASGTESANAIRITLSENTRERLWVAEVIEGNETRVAMVHLEPGAVQASVAKERLVLHRTTFASTAELAGRWVTPPANEPVLAAVGANTGLVILKQNEVMIFSMSSAGWREEQRIDLDHQRSMTRDPRGMLLPTADGNGFTAITPGAECTGSYATVTDNSGHYGDWSLHCRESDDPWPIVQASTTSGAGPIKAFYNATRNYFIGVVNGSLGVDLPPFYSAAILSRPASRAALLINGIDGKVQIVENGALKPVAGTRDWGSDFAALNSGCGAGAQIITSSSGEALTDSLRAYELPALEAIPASAPLAMDGTVTALWTAPDGKSVYAVVRSAADEYEVDRVSASCN